MKKRRGIARLLGMGMAGLTIALSLTACMQSKPTQQETTAETTPQVTGPTAAELQIHVADQTFQAGHYVSVPVEVSSSQGVQAVELQFEDLPAGVEFIGIESREGTFAHVHTLPHTSTEEATLFFNKALTQQQVNFVFKVDVQRPISFKAQATAFVGAGGEGYKSTVAGVFSLKLGQGGTAQQPTLSTLLGSSALLGNELTQQGTLKAQSSSYKYEIPTVMQSEWKDYEPGDINQDHRVDVADGTLLIGFLLGTKTPTPYQLYAADLDEKLTDGKKVLNGYDYWAFVAKKDLSNLKIIKDKPYVHPLAVEVNEPKPALILAGNAGYGPLDLKVEVTEPWIQITRVPTYNVTTQAFEVKTNAPEGSKGFVNITYPSGEVRQVEVTALAPPAAPPTPPVIIGGSPDGFTGAGGVFTLVMLLEDEEGKAIHEALGNDNFEFHNVKLSPVATPDDVISTGQAVPVRVENGGQVEQGPVSMMIAIDQSGSMGGNDPKRLRYDAAKQLISTLKSPDEVGVMSLQTVDQSLTTDYALASEAVGRVSGGSSDIYGGIRIAVRELENAQHPNKAIVALTDGETGLGNFERSVIEANDAGVNVYTVGLGSNLDFSKLQEVADRTGGAFAHVQNANDLQAVFDAIGRSIQQGGTRLTGQVTLDSVVTKAGTYLLTGAVKTSVRGQTFETPFSVRVYVDGKDVVALPPVLQSMTPAEGPTKGGTKVVIKGTDLSRVNKVMFGTVPATQFTINSATQITAVVPAQASGEVPVSLIAPEGTSNTAKFTYQSDSLVSGISPKIMILGDTPEIVIAGEHLENVDKIEIDGIKTDYSILSGNKITLTSQQFSKVGKHTLRVYQEGRVIKVDTIEVIEQFTVVEKEYQPSTRGNTLLIEGTGLDRVDTVSFSGKSLNFSYDKEGLKVDIPPHLDYTNLLEIKTNRGETWSATLQSYTPRHRCTAETSYNLGLEEWYVRELKVRPDFPSVTPKDIQDLEEAYGVPMPKAFVEFMCIAGGDWGFLFGLPELDSPEMMIFFKRLYEEKFFAESMKAGTGDPSQVVVFAGDVSDYAYFMYKDDMIMSEDPQVYFYSYDRKDAGITDDRGLIGSEAIGITFSELVRIMAQQ